MLTYISIFVTAIFVNNIVLSQFLGICPFLGVSKRIDSALGMGAAVTFVMTIATIVTYLLQTSLYQALGFFLPLITTNCTILGVALIVIQKNLSLLEATVYAISTAIGFTLALVIFAGMREQMSLSHIPKAMQGTPIALIAAGLLAMAFMGFSGIKIG